MPWHRQASVLARFGEGDVNLLLATSVCEEGMDIQVSIDVSCGGMQY